MSTREQASKLLGDVGTRLRELMVKAARDGDDESVLLLMSLGRAATELAAKAKNGEVPSSYLSIPALDTGHEGAATGPPSADRKKSSSSARTKTGGEPDGQPGSPRRKKARRKSKKRKRRSEFPKFRRQGNALLKIGYSKRSGMYTHRASREVLRVVTNAIGRAGDGGKLFTVDDIMAVTESSTNPEILSYQVYLCLAWIRHDGLVKAQGRQGYRIATDGQLLQAVEERWNALPEE